MFDHMHNSSQQVLRSRAVPLAMLICMNSQFSETVMHSILCIL